MDAPKPAPAARDEHDLAFDALLAQRESGLAREPKGEDQRERR